MKKGPTTANASKGASGQGSRPETAHKQRQKSKDIASRTVEPRKAKAEGLQQPGLRVVSPQSRQSQPREDAAVGLKRKANLDRRTHQMDAAYKSGQSRGSATESKAGQ